MYSNNTYFSRGGNFRYIREFGFCAKFSSREINIHCAWNFAKFSSREIFLHAKIKYEWWFNPPNMQTNSKVSMLQIAESYDESCFMDLV